VGLGQQPCGSEDVLERLCAEDHVRVFVFDRPRLIEDSARGSE
jgi:hypothetical protein